MIVIVVIIAAPMMVLVIGCNSSNAKMSLANEVL